GYALPRRLRSAVRPGSRLQGLPAGGGPGDAARRTHPAPRAFRAGAARGDEPRLGRYGPPEGINPSGGTRRRNLAHLTRGDAARPRGAARFLGLGTGNRHPAAAELGLVHAVEAQAVVEQHLALGGVRHVFSSEERGDGAWIRMAVVSRLADEERVEVEVIRGEQHRVLAEVVDEERNELVAGLAGKEHPAALDVLAG